MSCADCDNRAAYGPFTRDLCDPFEPELPPGDRRPDYREPARSYGAAPPATPPSPYASVDTALVRNSVYYQRNRVDDSPWQYVGGNLVAVHIRPLPFGLLGYTDTRTSINLTTPDLCRPFEVGPREVAFHERNHFGCWDEYTNRWQVEVNRHLWDIEAGVPPLEQAGEPDPYGVRERDIHDTAVACC